MPVVPTSWSDARLDRLEQRVDKIEPAVMLVRELRVEMRGLAKELEANTASQQKVAAQFDQAQIEPLTRARNLRSQLYIALGAALAGGGLAVLGALLAGGGH